MPANGRTVHRMIPEHDDMRQSRQHFPQYLELLSAELWKIEKQPGQIASLG